MAEPAYRQAGKPKSKTSETTGDSAVSEIIKKQKERRRMSSQPLETTLRIRALILQARNNSPIQCILDREVNNNVQLVIDELGEDAFSVSEETLRQRYAQ